MSTPLEQPARSTPQRWPMMAIFAVIWGALMLTEQLSIHLLPATVREHTSSPFLISLILFLNPLFGVIAQPLVGIIGDRIWTPIGRRAFFLITGAPIVGICLWFIPEARFLWHIFVLVLIYQFFQDILWGSDHPLLADLFPPKQRLYVSGMLITCGQATGAIFLKFGMTNFEADELYRIVAILQVLLVTGLSFFLNERPPDKAKLPRLTFRGYFRDLFADPTRRRFAFLYFCLSLLMNIAVFGGFLRIFAMESLGASQEEYGDTFAVSAIGPLFLSVPMAWLVERYTSKRMAMLLGIVFLITALSIGWTAQSIDQIFWLAIMWGIGYMLTIVTFKPFFSEYVPKEILGQVSGALNICWGIGRSIAIVAAGAAVEFLFDNNYRYIFPMSIVMGIASFIIAWSIPDLRYEARKAKAKGGVAASENSQ